MARVPRYAVVDKKGGFFHVVNRIAAYIGDYPLQRPEVSGEFIRRFKVALSCFRIHCAELTVMGNHFHAVLFVEEFRLLSRRKLERLARARWGKLWKLRTCYWSDGRWEKFNQEVFDLSSFMHDLQGPFTVWFNKMFDRRGTLWGHRFKCLALAHNLRAVQEEMIYVALNPVRAKLVDLPEQWRGGSAYLRSVGQADFLMPLEAIFINLAREKVSSYYRHLTLYRGLTPRRADQAEIPAEIVAAQIEQGFPPGLYLDRHRFMTDGLMLGSKDAVLRKLEEMTEVGIYRRKCNVAEHLNGLFHTVREQRSHCRW